MSLKPSSNFENNQMEKCIAGYSFMKQMPDSEEAQSLKCTKCHTGNGKCDFQKSECKRFHANIYVYLIGSVLAFVCLLQLSWNLHLNDQLTLVRRDIDILMKTPCNTLQTGFVKQSEGELNVLSKEKVLNSPSSSDVQSSSQRKHESKDDPNHQFQEQLQDQSSLRVKRSTDKSKKSSRKKKRGGKINQYIRKHKAISIHVQAQRKPSSNVSPRIHLPGSSLKGWQKPSSKYKGFDTSKLISQGYITVPTNGFYFVYSQVIFLTSDIPHMVAEIGVNTRGSNTFTKCQFSRSANTSQQDSYVTCNSNGVVYLSKGEGVSLIVNPPNARVFMAPEYTYFGAFLVGL